MISIKLGESGFHPGILRASTLRGYMTETLPHRRTRWRSGHFPLGSRMNARLREHRASGRFNYAGVLGAAPCPILESVQSFVDTWWTIGFDGRCATVHVAYEGRSTDPVGFEGDSRQDPEARKAPARACPTSPQSQTSIRTFTIND